MLQRNSAFNTRNVDMVSLFKLLLNGTNLILIFKMKFFFLLLKSIFAIYDANFKQFFLTAIIKLFTRPFTGLSHLREHKFKNSTQDSLNPISWCSINIESFLTPLSPI